MEKKNNELMWLRVTLLDELIHHNGKQLDSALIGEITSNVVEKLGENVKSPT